MKRFWDSAAIAPAQGGWQVTLDGRPMHVPGGAALTLPTAPLARAVAAEWQAAGGGRGGETSFADLPLTRIAGTGQERIAPNREPVILQLARYGESDLLCYRAEAPDQLVKRQAAAWQPWLDWAARTYDAPLRVSSGITYVKQHRDSIAALRRAVAALDVPALAALGIAVPALGSLVLGLALAEGKLDAATAYSLGALDELFQAELWGEDAEAAARRQSIADDIALAERLLRLTR